MSIFLAADLDIQTEHLLNGTHYVLDDQVKAG